MGVSGAAGGASALSTFSGAYAQANAIKSKSEYDAMQAEINQRLLELQAEDSIEAGNRAAVKEQVNAKKMQSSQRAAAAASGVQVDYGSAANAVYDTEALSETNVNKIKENAWLEAWGYRFQKEQIRSQDQFNQMAAKNEANLTIASGLARGTVGGLQTGLQVAQYRNPDFMKKKT